MPTTAEEVEKLSWRELLLTETRGAGGEWCRSRRAGAVDTADGKPRASPQTSPFACPPLSSRIAATAATARPRFLLSPPVS